MIRRGICSRPSMHRWSRLTPFTTPSVSFVEHTLYPTFSSQAAGSYNVESRRSLFTSGDRILSFDTISTAFNTITSPAAFYDLVCGYMPSPVAFYRYASESSHDHIVQFSNGIASMSTNAASSSVSADVVCTATSSVANDVIISASEPAASAVATVAAATLGQPSLPALFLGLICFGAAIRLISTPLSLYGDRAVSRMIVAGPELHSTFVKYAEVIEHESVTAEDVRAAGTRLWTRRKKIMLRRRTSNTKILLPPVINSLWVAGIGTCVASSVVPALVHAWATEHVVGSSIAIAAAGTSANSFPWWIQTAAGIPDPTVAVALALISYNLHHGVSRRLGFSDKKDAGLKRYRFITTTSMGLTACFSLVYPVYMAASASTSSTLLLPAVVTYLTCAGNPSTAVMTVGVGGTVYGTLTALGPFLLGVSLVGLIQTAINSSSARTVPLKRFLNWPTEMPRMHGHYGREAFTPQEHMKWEQVLDVAQKKRDTDYERNLRIIEGDCDRKLKKMGSVGARLLHRYGYADLKPRQDLVITQRPT